MTYSNSDFAVRGCPAGLAEPIRQWPLLATQFAPQGSQAERSESEQR
jgi:hypothetical protein